MEVLVWILTVFVGYLVGSFPTGFIAGRFKGLDLRRIGSGNIGATNVLRTGNKMIGYITLILDILKAIVPLLVIKFNYPEFLFTCNFLVSVLNNVFFSGVFNSLDYISVNDYGDYDNNLSNNRYLIMP